jgi:hypothetical protein
MVSALAHVSVSKITHVAQILMHHIRATLPDIKARIQQQLQKFNAELQSLGGAMGDSNSASLTADITRVYPH